MLTNRKFFYYFRLFIDLFLLNVSFILAAVLSQSWQTLIEREYMFVLLAILNFVWYFISNVIEFYEDFEKRFFSFQFINIIKITLAQIITVIIFIFFVKENLFTRNFTIYYGIFLILFSILRFYFIQILVKQIRKSGKNLINLLIIGYTEVGKNFYTFIKENPGLNYNFIGFIKNNDDDETDEVITQTKIDAKIIGKISELEKIILDYKIEEIIIALPNSDSSNIDNIIRISNKNAVRVHIIPDYFKFLSKKFRIDMIGDFPIITVRDEPLAEFHWQFIKRVFDIFISFFVIILIIPILSLIILILNKIYSPGPLFYVQDRIGEKNKIFKCYKYRSMHIKKSNDNVFQPVTEDDPRISKIGKLIRKYSIDEIPQFINVFLGDMSIVGPRPHQIEFDKAYSQFIEEIKLRSLVKPGITGWAQIHGFRGDVKDKEENQIRTKKRIEYDIWYIENWSFWLDLQIIFLTIWRIITGKVQGV